MGKKADLRKRKRAKEEKGTNLFYLIKIEEKNQISSTHLVHQGNNNNNDKDNKHQQFKNRK